MTCGSVVGKCLLGPWAVVKSTERSVRRRVYRDFIALLLYRALVIRWVKLS